MSEAMYEVPGSRLRELSDQGQTLRRRIQDAHASIQEAQRLAFELLEASGAHRIDPEERSPEQVRLATLYSLIHDGVKQLAGRRDIELPGLDEAHVLNIEYRVVIAELRQRLEAL